MAEEQPAIAPYHSLESLIAMIDPPQRGGCERLLSENLEVFRAARGSTHNHQAWPGGYLDHVQEAMNAAVLLYASISRARPLPFSLSSALVVIFLHDLEKPWKYERGEDGAWQHRSSLQGKDAHQAFRLAKLAEYGIALSLEEENGIRYIEGEIGDYSNRERKMGPLAAFCHMADVTSARLWFDHPRAEGDPWPGARRTLHT